MPIALRAKALKLDDLVVGKGCHCPHCERSLDRIESTLREVVERCVEIAERQAVRANLIAQQLEVAESWIPYVVEARAKAFQEIADDIRREFLE